MGYALRPPLMSNVRPQKKRKNVVAAFQSRQPCPCPRGCNVACSKGAKQSFAISKNMRGALNIASSGGNKNLSANYFDNFERSLRGCFLSRSGSAGVIA